MTDVPSVEPGEWYYGVLCRRCRSLILLAHDPSGGVTACPGNDPNLLLRCDQEACGFEDEYSAREIQNMRAPYRT